MKRIIVGVVIVAAVGIFAYSLYNRTGAETVAPATAVEAPKASPGTCGSTTCASAACVDPSSACSGCPYSKGTAVQTSADGTCKCNPECTCKGDCKDNPNCTCPEGCKAKCTGDCAHKTMTSAETPQAQPKSACSGSCPGTCSAKKASGT